MKSREKHFNDCDAGPSCCVHLTWKPQKLKTQKILKCFFWNMFDKKVIQESSDDEADDEGDIESERP